MSASTTEDNWLTTDDDSNSSSDGNCTVCCDPDMINYIPTVEEYKEALGGYGVAIVTIGSLSTTLLYLLFFQQVWHTFANTHKVYRRHIYWLISIFPFVTLMSTLALVVPRAHQICSAIKVTYMSIGVGHFADLTVLLYGSENKMAEDVKDTPMRLDLLPLCCCCRCIPSIKTSKLRLSVIKWMVWQLKWTQAAYYIMRHLLAVAKQDSEGTVIGGKSFVFLTNFNFGSFLIGIYALNILNALSFEHLARFRYRAKSSMIKVLVVFVKMQAFVFDLMGIYKVMPCLGPYITPVAYDSTLENSMLLVEMLIFGLISYVMYSRVEFRDYKRPVEPPTPITSKPTGGASGDGSGANASEQKSEQKVSYTSETSKVGMV